jgi:hypothetical protein
MLSAESLRVFGFKLACAACLALTLTSVSVLGQNESARARPKGTDPKPTPAIPAILSAFDRYEVVGMSEAHGLKDADDFILALIRTPAFASKVNDIAVECGNSLYQPVLDRYVAGEDVPFAEVRKVWRNTTQLMCGMSGFFEQLFPLIRAINQKLPQEKRLRVLAGDPPIDWDRIKKLDDIGNVIHDRDQTIAAVMETQVLSKHRKALMLFGVFHLMHQPTFGNASAVAIYEKQYPKSTFVIAGFEGINVNLSTSSLLTWPTPSIARANGNWLGALKLSEFTSPPIITRNCVGKIGFPEGEDKRMDGLVDAFLYLAPPGLALREEMPANIVSDFDFMAELSRRASLLGEGWMVPWTVKDGSSQIVKSAENPLLEANKPPDSALLATVEKECREVVQRLGKREPPPPLPHLDEPFTVPKN